MVSVDAVKHHEKRKRKFRVQELREQGSGPRLPLILHPILPPSLVSHAVSMDAVKHHGRRKQRFRAPDLCEEGYGPGLSFPIPFFPSP